MQGKPGEKRENWLLIKGDDDFARPDSAPDILEERPESVTSGLTLDDLAAGTKPKPRARAKPASPKAAPMPGFIPPSLAELAASPPKGAGWLHEIKFDGYRLQAHVAGKAVRLFTRNGHDWTDKFGPDIATAFRALPCQEAIIDGELVVENDAGASDFSALQADLSEGRRDRFLFYAFDLLHLDGQPLLDRPLTDRKAALAKLLREAGPLRYSEHFDDPGAIVISHACRLSLEGIVSKQGKAPYRSGRSKTWIKSKCSARQEFVVAGYEPSSTSARAIGSLLLGLYEGETLVYVGRVGTGFTQKVAADLFRRMQPMEQDTNPFSNPKAIEDARKSRFLRPDLVAEVEFRAWTGGGQLRHASFRGLRDDKDARTVVREDKAMTPNADTPPPPRRRVPLTHPDRLYWPEDGVTKEGLADYYAEVWRFIAPFIVGRPLALLRCPSGIDGQQFFQKHAWRGAGKAIVRIPDPGDPAEPFVGVNDLDGLMSLVQAAVLEIHPWGATTKDMLHPDMITMDLDPGEGVDWPTITVAALEVRDRLTALGLPAFLKTSGGKGLHVVTPLKPKADWAAAKAFAKGLADQMAADSPDRFVSTIKKDKRKGRILVDYLRNQYGATAVAAYSTRARPGAPVSAPLTWDELPDITGADHYTVMTMPTRLAALDEDPWHDFRAQARVLPEGAKKKR
jgi:bifunctional non-homologous end joining protein LigD